MDNVQGGEGNDTILSLVSSTAANSTFTLGDNINGNGGEDTLKIVTDTNSVNLGAATVQNVEMLDVNMDAAAAPGTVGTAEVAGSVNLNSVAFTKATIEGVTGDDATNGNSDTLTVSNANLATKVVLEDITDVASTVSFSGATGTSDEASVEVAGSTDTAATGQNNDLSVDNIETLNLAFTTAANDLNVVTADDAKTVNLSVADKANTTLRGKADFSAATVVNIAAAGNLTLAATGGEAAALANDAVVTVTGAGKVNLGTLDDNGAGEGVTVDGSAMTGGLTVTGGLTTVSITGGAGNDKVTTGAISTKVALGAGDDTFDTNSLDLGGTAAVDVDGGDGTDTIVMDDGDELDAAAAAHIKNFETLDIVGGQDVYNLSVLKFSTVNVSGDLAGNATIDNITDETINITGDVDNTGTLTLDLKDSSGTSDALTVNIEGVYSNAGTPTVTTDDANDVEVAEIIVAGVETLTLNSGDNDAHKAGVQNEVKVLATDATKVVVTGDHDLKITDFQNAASNAVNATIKTIDASASAGLIMGDSVSTANVSLIGSAQADTLLVGTADGTAGSAETGSTVNAGAGGDVVTIAGGNAAAADTLIIDAGDSKIGYTDTNKNGNFTSADDAELYDIVTGFTSGEDTLDLGSFGFTGQKASGLASATISSADVVKLIEGETTSIANFFVDTGVQRGVAVASGDYDLLDDANTVGTDDTLVFIDSDGDGNLTAADDMVVLSGTTSVTLADFGF